ncbi:MAG: 16S rRNA (guanine(966)-N(2))-methyltransferase RsmD [Firmicutes bacterium]|nr:16S rRNA (guanine(966)-N(2))-methyltransferase RsmD [Bacillota bacterium]
MGRVLLVRVISGIARGRKLKTLKGRETRPTGDKVKESLFNIIYPLLSGALMLDIFAGTGSIGIEALSRGAEKCVFIEKNRQCVKIIAENLALCGFSDVGEIIPSDVLPALAALGRKKSKFDIIFLDPPYRSTLLVPVLAAIAENALVAEDGIVVVEHHADDNNWWSSVQWHIKRRKKYGDTAITFLTPAKLEGGERNGNCNLPGKF